MFALRFAAPLIILGAGVLGFAALMSQRETPTEATQVATATLVETVPVASHRGEFDIVVDGQVVPFREIKLSAEVAGPIRFKSEVCRAGKVVSQGTLLYEIDPSDFELEVRRLTSDLDQADAMIGELDVELANTQKLVLLAEEDLVLRRKQIDRFAGLGSRVVPDSEVDRVQSEALASENALTLLQNQAALLEKRRARLESAKLLVASQLEKAELDLARTKVVAPIDGMVVDDAVEVNSYVQRGTLLVTLEDTSAVEVRCSLLMEDLNWIWGQAAHGGLLAGPATSLLELPPTPATIVYKLGGQEFTWQGVLSRYEGVGIDQRTRTVPCRILVSQPIRSTANDSRGGRPLLGPPALVRGMYVSVRVHVASSTPMLKLPAYAIRAGNQAWKLNDGKLEIVPLNIARRIDQAVLVFDGESNIAVGDRIIVSPMSSVYEGMEIREQASSDLAPGELAPNEESVP